MRLILLLGISTMLPVAWMLAEFKAGPGIRRLLGMVTLLWSFGVASLAGCLRDFDANVYFTGATKDLLTASVEQLKAGKAEAVLREWSRAGAEFNPTYENRANYRQIVDQTIAGMKQP